MLEETESVFRSIAYYLLSWFVGLIAALAPISTPAETPPTKNARVAFLLERADQMNVEVASEDGEFSPASRVATPALRFQNPLYEAQSDGVLLIWTHDELPVAFASYSIRNDKTVFREFAISSDTALRCTLDDRVAWSPTVQFPRREFARGVPVPDNPRLRLRTIRRLAERFKSGNKRVLTTPILQYQNVTQGIVDGAVFALSDTNDPEMLVIIEAHVAAEPKTPSWRYTLARMNSQPQQVHMDGQLVWDLKGYWNNPRSINDPYVEQRDAELPDELKLTRAE